MANQTLPVASLLTDPGMIYWAPLGTPIPASGATPPVPGGNVVGGVFTDVWPAAWIPLGRTDSGSDWGVTTTVSPIMSAEDLDPLAYRTTDRTGQIDFMLKSVTATNMMRAYNGATLTVTGTAGTLLTQLTPVTPGLEIRAMLGWESLDNTYRRIAYQVFNSGDIKLAFKKAPASTAIPWVGMLEKPASSPSWVEFFAGSTRA